VNNMNPEAALEAEGWGNVMVEAYTSQWWQRRVTSLVRLLWTPNRQDKPFPPPRPGATGVGEVPWGILGENGVELAAARRGPGRRPRMKPAETHSRDRYQGWFFGVRFSLPWRLPSPSAGMLPRLD
jgi:hypothetical protein